MPQFIVELTDEQIKILENDLLDVNTWIQGAVQGKINNCKKRAAREEVNNLINSGADTIPAKEDDLIKSLFARPGYKSRKARENG